MITKFIIERSTNNRYIVTVEGELELSNMGRAPAVNVYCCNTRREVFELADELFGSD